MIIFLSAIKAQEKSNELKDLSTFIKLKLKEGTSYPKDSLYSLENLVNLNQFDSIYGLPSVEMFDYLLSSNRYAFFFDIDGDNNKELISFQIEGSMLNPILLIFKYDPKTNKFKELKSFKDINVYPLTFNSQLYFLDYYIDFNSKHLKGIGIYILSADYELEKLIVLPIKYSYLIPLNLKNFIRDEFLTSLDNFSLVHLSKIKNIQHLDFRNMILTNSNDTLTYKIDWTSVGYYPSLIDVSIKNSLHQDGTYQQLTGFDIQELENRLYLIISRYDQCCDVNIEVIEISSLKTVATGHLKTERSVEELNPQDKKIKN